MSEAEYVLYYWPSIPGRGEFVKFVLEEAGASYRDVGRERGSEAIMEARRGWARSFAPPVIEHGEGHVRLSQTPIICSWLGERHGLAPEGEAERLQARALQATIADVVAEVHALHHPIATALYYDDQKVEATRAAGHFRDGRLAEWLEFFEGAIKGPWVFGEGISHVDLCLCVLVRGLRYAMPRAMTRLQDGCPDLVRVVEAVASRAQIATYLASDRAVAPNEDGIFRHYNDLDDAA